MNPTRKKDICHERPALLPLVDGASATQNRGLVEQDLGHTSPRDLGNARGTGLLGKGSRVRGEQL